MQLANSLVDPTPIYQPAARQARPEGCTLAGAVPILHMVAEPALRGEIEAALLDLRVEVDISLVTGDTACRKDPHRAACAVIDLDMHNTDTCSLLSTLAGKDKPPVILIGGCNEPRFLVRAMKLGAFDCLPRPLNIAELVNAILSAIDQDLKQAPKRLEEWVLRDRTASLTPREREVLPLVVGGLLNKQAAAILGISEITLQIHRGQVMRKMQANSLADLVRMCVRLRIRHWRPAA